MINKDMLIHSSDQKTKLALHIEGMLDAKAIIVFSHGMAEHKERYYDFIHFLTQQGYLCAIHDHRGHGDSVANPDDYGYLEDENGEFIVQDLDVIVNYMKQQYPNKEIYLFAHSMGTLVARCYLQKHDQKIAKTVLCGPPYNNKGAAIGRTLAKILAKLHGDKYRSTFIQKIAFGSFDKKFNASIANEWVSSDIKQVENYNKNAKCGYIFTTNGFQCLFALVRSTYRKKAYLVNNKELALLYIAGGDDPVIGNKKKFLNEIQFMKKLGYRNIHYILYPKLRHELLNEVGNENIYQDILNFYNK